MHVQSFRALQSSFSSLACSLRFMLHVFHRCFLFLLACFSSFVVSLRLFAHKLLCLFVLPVSLFAQLASHDCLLEGLRVFALCLSKGIACLSGPWARWLEVDILLADMDFSVVFLRFQSEQFFSRSWKSRSAVQNPTDPWACALRAFRWILSVAVLVGGPISVTLSVEHHAIAMLIPDNFDLGSRSCVVAAQTRRENAPSIAIAANHSAPLSSTDQLAVLCSWAESLQSF